MTTHFLEYSRTYLLSALCNLELIHIISVSGFCGLHIQNLSNCCRHEVWPPNFTNFLECNFWRVFAICPECAPRRRIAAAAAISAARTDIKRPQYCTSVTAKKNLFYYILTTASTASPASSAFASWGLSTQFLRLVNSISWGNCEIKEKDKEKWGHIPMLTCTLKARTTDARWSPFSIISQIFVLGQTNWADKSWNIFGIFGQTISTILARDKTRQYLQLSLRQWGAGNVYLLVLSSWNETLPMPPLP